MFRGSGFRFLRDLGHKIKKRLQLDPIPGILDREIFRSGIPDGRCNVLEPANVESPSAWYESDASNTYLGSIGPNYVSINRSQ